MIMAMTCTLRLPMLVSSWSGVAGAVQKSAAAGTTERKSGQRGRVGGAEAHWMKIQQQWEEQQFKTDLFLVAKSAAIVCLMCCMVLIGPATTWV
jgi:predicted lipid-binding transport protein (Tim44 family)